jgi:hypothetical protein
MTAGKSYGPDRKYQELCRSILAKRAAPLSLAPCAGDGIDVPFRLGSADRTFDVALMDENGQLVVAECRRTKDPVKLSDLDSFAHRVELLRRTTNRGVAAVYFTKTAYQIGVVKAAADSGIEVAVCAQDQPPSSLALVFQLYDAERERRLRRGEALLEGSIKSEASLSLKVIRADGTVEDKGRV